MAEPQGKKRRQRSDARQSVVLDAAIRTLAEHPDASMDEIARAAGVSRQTVYAHFPSREVLIDAVTEQAGTEFTALFNSLELDRVPPPQALHLPPNRRRSVERILPFCSRLKFRHTNGFT